MNTKFMRVGIFLTLLTLFMNPQDIRGQKSATELIAKIPPPKIQNQVDLTDGIRQLTLYQSTLYVGNVWGGLQIVDISNIKAPANIAYLTFPDEVKGSTINGEYLYLANHGEGIAILKILPDGNLQKIDQVKTPGAAEWVEGEYPILYVALGKDGFAIMDASDPQTPLTLSLEIPGTWVDYLVKRGNLLYVSGKRDGFFIYDISDKEHPIKLRQYKTGYTTFMSHIDGNLAYLADGPGGLLIMDISNPKFPVEISRLPVNGTIDRLYKSGNYVYLCDRDFGLRIVNVSNPRKPFLEGEYVTESTCYDVIKKDVYLFVATNTATLIMRHNNAPVLEKIGDLSLNEGQPFGLQLQYTEPDGDSVYFEAQNLPPGSQFDSSTGFFSWYPDYEASGVYPNVIFRVVEKTASQLSDADTLTITVNHVNRPPDLPALADTTILENTPLTLTVLPGSDPDKEDQGHLIYRVENLPIGATFDPVTRQFNWTPTYDQSGIYVVDFILDDGAGGIDREPVTITVKHVDRPPRITALKDTTINEGDTLKIKITGTEPDREDQDKIIFTMKNLPEGAKFDSASHTFLWVPNFDQSGVYPDISATMQAGVLKDSTLFTITVKHVNRPPVLTTVGDQVINENQPLVLNIEGSDPDKEDAGKLKIYVKNLPDAATYDSTKAQILWNPTFEDAGTYPITIGIRDPQGLTDEKTINLVVKNVNRPPKLKLPETQTITVGDTLRLTLQASDPDPEDQDKLKIEVTDLPENARFDPTSGTLEWVPQATQAGTYKIQVSVTDGEGAKSQGTITINVKAAEAGEQSPETP